MIPALDVSTKAIAIGGAPKNTRRPPKKRPPVITGFSACSAS
jgi:hypothetical protein